MTQDRLVRKKQLRRASASAASDQSRTSIESSHAALYHKAPVLKQFRMKAAHRNKQTLTKWTVRNFPQAILKKATWTTKHSQATHGHTRWWRGLGFAVAKSHFFCIISCITFFLRT